VETFQKMHQTFEHSTHLHDRLNQTFEQKYYRKNLRKYGIKIRGRDNLLNHFHSYCKSLQLSPNRVFDTSFYLMQYSDIRENAVNPYLHYLEFGWLENRKPNSSISEEQIMTKQYKKQISYVEIEMAKKFARTLSFVGKNRFFNPFLWFKKLIFLTKKTKDKRLKPMLIQLQQNIQLGETSRNAYESYLKIASIVVHALHPESVLKTDCHNETNRFAINIPLIPFLCQKTKQVECLEISPQIIAEARRFNQIPNNCRVTVGSITESHFVEKNFDLILDFSTTDHLKDTEVSSALKQYSRICKTNGVVVICTWTADRYRYIESELQSYFSKVEFEKKVKQYFSILLTRNLLVIEDKILILYVLHPKEKK
jgi:SAM-dependent methyltransferase